MSRTEKNTRIRPLPPKVQLTQKDSITGSYPTNARGAVVDNRTGVYGVKFNDQNTFIFTSGSGTALTSPIGIIAGVNDSTLSYSNVGQALSPYHDDAQFAADGKSQQRNFFFASRSVDSLGSRFGSPLWSKHKIEINLSTQTAVSMGTTLGPTKTSENMTTYYNHASATWMPVGSMKTATYYISQAITTPTLGIGPYFKEKAHPFGPSALDNVSYLEYPLGSATPSREFGFPFDGKYFVDTRIGASASILYPMSGVINRPFVVEQIVLDFTGSLTSSQFNCGWSGGATGFATANFFVLNQRKQVPVINENTKLYDKTTFTVTESYVASPRSGTMDIVTSLVLFTPGATEVVFSGTNFAAAATNFFRSQPNTTFIFPESNASYLGWSKRLLITGSICSPPQAVVTGSTNTPAYTLILSGTSYYRIMKTYPISRNGLENEMTGDRNFLNGFAGAQYKPVQTEVGTYVVNSAGWSANPYILYPQDQLIFGWSGPALSYIFEQQGDNPPSWIAPGDLGPQFTVGVGDAKVVLYGFFLDDGEESIDPLSQNLSSESVHEALETS